MKILVNSGVVESRQEGKWTHYSICPNGVRHVMDLISDYTADYDYGFGEADDHSKEKTIDCSRSDHKTFSKSIVIDYLCLDLETCDRCIGTDRELDEVIMALTPALMMAGYKVDYNKIIISTVQEAREHSFLASPTVRVNGKDICLSIDENSCGCCSDISGTDVNCRVFVYNGQTFEVPPKEMLADAILGSIFRDENSCGSLGDYEMPKNLVDFFEGKKSKPACSCETNCC